MKKVNLKEAKGITLVALVITVIILLILAGVALSLVIGENGLIAKSKQGVGVYKQSAENETEQLGSFEDELTKVKVGEIFDKNGKNESEKGYDPNKLHIGDFVNYDAGTWTQDEINAIKVGTKGSEVGANNDANSLPNTNFQFGGFRVGTSRNGNAKPFSSYNYVKENGKAVTGWRVFDVGEDGSVTLISAGCPEDYYHPYTTNGAYISEYILTGNINSNATSLNLDTTYTKRDWSKYVNKNQKATEATALTKAKLDNWYNKYMGFTNANTYSKATFQSVYTTKYESMIDNYAYYWLSSAYNGNGVYCLDPYGSCVNYYYYDPFGVRVLVTLSSDVKFSSEKVGTKTLTDPRTANNSWTYNVWDIK